MSSAALPPPCTIAPRLPPCYPHPQVTLLSGSLSRGGLGSGNLSLNTLCVLRKEKLKPFSLSLSKGCHGRLNFQWEDYYTGILPVFPSALPHGFRKAHWALRPTLHDLGWRPHVFPGLPAHRQLSRAFRPAPACWHLGQSHKSTALKSKRTC